MFPVSSRLQSLSGTVIIFLLFLRPCTPLDANTHCFAADLSELQQGISINPFSRSLIEYPLYTEAPADSSFGVGNEAHIKGSTTEDTTEGEWTLQ